MFAFFAQIHSRFVEAIGSQSEKFGVDGCPFYKAMNETHELLDNLFFTYREIRITAMFFQI